MTSIAQFLIENGILLTLVLLLTIGLVYSVGVLMDEDRSAVLRGRAFKVLHAATGKREHEKAYVGNDAKGRLNLARRSMHHGTTLIPEPVRIEWVETASPRSYDISEGEFVVVLDPAENQHKNIVNLAEVIVEHTSLLGLRHIAPVGMRRAFDFTLVKKLLRALGNQRATDVFFTEVYYPYQETDEEFDKWNPRLVEIDEQGLFERLLLVELEDYGRRIAEMEPRLYMLGEVEDLVRFVHRLATRKEKEEVPLRFLKAHIRIGVILVAKIDKVLQEGIEPYLEAVRINIKQEAETFYVIIWDKPHLKSRRLQDWRLYRKARRQLLEAVEQLEGVQWQFTWKYAYLDPNKVRRDGSISRYMVDLAAAKVPEGQSVRREATSPGA